MGSRRPVCLADSPSMCGAQVSSLPHDSAPPGSRLSTRMAMVMACGGLWKGCSGKTPWQTAADGGGTPVDKFAHAIGWAWTPERSQDGAGRLLGIVGGCVGNALPQAPCPDRADLGAVGSRTSRGRLFGAIVWTNQSLGSCWFSWSTNLGRVEGWVVLPTTRFLGTW